MAEAEGYEKKTCGGEKEERESQDDNVVHGVWEEAEPLVHLAGDGWRGQLWQVRRAEEGEKGRQDGEGNIRDEVFQAEDDTSKVFLVCCLLSLRQERCPPNKTQYKTKILLYLASAR